LLLLLLLFLLFRGEEGATITGDGSSWSNQQPSNVSFALSFLCALRYEYSRWISPCCCCCCWNRLYSSTESDRRRNDGRGALKRLPLEFGMRTLFSDQICLFFLHSPSTIRGSPPCFESFLVGPFYQDFTLFSGSFGYWKPLITIYYIELTYHTTVFVLIM